MSDVLKEVENVETALRVATKEGVAVAVALLARAVAREEIERAANRQQDPPPSDTQPTPGGVRVVRTVAALDAVTERVGMGRTNAAAVIDAAFPRMRLEVDRETLESALIELIEESAGQGIGWLTFENMEDFADTLGLTLSDRGET